MILYLHGFQSSPLSFKAQLIARELDALGSDCRYICPELPLSPAKSVEMAINEIEKHPSDSITLIGSSLGGYYAGWLAERCHCRAVLLNPVIDPWKIKILDDMPEKRDLKVREWLDFRKKYEEELKTLRITRITYPARYLLLAAKGDELLDWQLMQSHYKDANQIIIDGSDHGLSTFSQYLDRVLLFCGVKNVAK